MTILDSSPAATAETPLVLVVEDNDQARTLRSDSLRKNGFDVIPASNSEGALVVLRDGPTIDLIVTDIHLGTADDDKGGVQLARTVRTSYDAELPVAAYSGYYYEHDLTEDEQSLFVVRQSRGAMSMRQQKEFYARCRAEALNHRRRRIERGAPYVSNRSADSIQTSDFVLKDDLDDIESALHRLGYELRLLTAPEFTELANPVPVWIRVGEVYEVQVCRQPLLHWSAESEESALGGLLSIMVGFAEDFRNSGDEPTGPARRLRDYLDRTVVGGAMPNRGQ